jgi:hypothetical protein
MPTALIIHGHFYQPPRENPWTNTVEREVGAEPYHDWNERIYAECYRPNAYARVFDDAGRILRIVNNYRHFSFNFGPTLLSWIERHHPMVYARIQAADEQSVDMHGGHGNAIAQAYNHTILPLANDRDRMTQVRWGVADFRRRFARAPESMWLPETAVNHATLATLIEAGMKYVILSPYQAERVREIGSEAWTKVDGNTLDTGVGYRWFHDDGSRRSIDVLFYNGVVSRAIAFDRVLASSSRALIDQFSRPNGGAGRLVMAATDGESYGHHTIFGDRCFAHAMEVEAEKQGFWVTNPAELLERHPPKLEVQIALGDDGMGSSWSCAHGVGRWMRHCGCHTGGSDGWTQEWRTPLKDAFDRVRDRAAEHLESIGGELFKDPWAARDQYIDVVLDPRGATASFFEANAKHRLDEAEQVRALTLLEMQRNALLMYTSCGWFFSDVSGLEAVQVMKYAARALDLMEELGVDAPREEMLQVLAQAKSNRNGHGTGADVFRKSAESVRITPRRVAAHVAMSSLIEEDGGSREAARYFVSRKGFRRRQNGGVQLVIGQVILQDEATRRTYDHAICALHFGGVDFYAVVKPFPGAIAFEESVERVMKRFPTASLPMLLRLAQIELGPEEYGLEHILPGGRERITESIFADLIRRFSVEYARLFEENRRTLEMLQSAGFQLPKELRAAAELTLSRQFEEEIRAQHQSQDPSAYKRALQIATEVAERGYQIDRTVSNQIFADMINGRVLAAVTNPSTENVEAARALIKLTRKLGVQINFDGAEETVYEAAISASRSSKADLEPLVALLTISPTVLQ